MQKRYPSLGCCIYCGRQPPTVRLTEEHVIPQGLRGNITFEGASCGREKSWETESCATITGRFEREYVRDAQDGLRTYLGIFGARRRNERRYKIPIAVEGKTLHLKPEECPFWAVHWIFDPPEILSGRPAARTVNLNLSLLAEPERHRPFVGKPFSVPGRHNATPLIRMLAKIGHGYAIGEYQIPFDFLTGIIREDNWDKSSDIWPRYIGVQRLNDRPSQNLHEIGLGCRAVNGRHVIVCSIRLFACLPASPTYDVVVGEHVDASLPPRSAVIPMPVLSAKAGA
jgi:hypothetical protein